MPVYSLSLHADYACRHSGACCTAGWRIPVEPSRQAALGTALLTPQPNGDCTFYDRPSGLCTVQRDRGVELMPLSCQQFPRIALIDERGTFVTLSHFCPTAAETLFAAGPLSIVLNPAGFPADTHYDGLDARGTWPPLVHPTLLFDHGSYAQWEAWIVSALDRDVSVESALGSIAEAAEHLRGWSDSAGSFADWALRTLAGTPLATSDAPSRYRRFAEWDAVAEIAQFGNGEPAPTLQEADDLRAFDEQWVAPVWNDQARIVRRYLATKAFASWCAYQARGVRTLVAELYATTVVFRAHLATLCAANRRPPDRAALVQAIRRSDWLLVHGIHRERFTEWLGEVEHM